MSSSHKDVVGRDIQEGDEVVFAPTSRAGRLMVAVVTECSFTDGKRWVALQTDTGATARRRDLEVSVISRNQPRTE